MLKKIALALTIFNGYCLTLNAIHPDEKDFGVVRHSEHGMYSIVPYHHEGEDNHQAELLALFERERKILIARPEFDVKKMLECKTVNFRDQNSYGKLHIKVLRAQGQHGVWEVKGFITYWKTDEVSGQLSMMAVNPQDRRKGFAHALLTHAIDDLRKKGAASIWAYVNKANINSQNAVRKAADKEGLDFKMVEAGPGAADAYKMFLTPKK